MRVAMVLGGGACVWRDVEAALAMGEFHGVVTCNDVTASWPGEIDAAVSLHSEKWPLWLERRRREGRPAPARVFGHSDFTRSSVRQVDCVTDLTAYLFHGQADSGSSGLFALKVALVDLGFDRAVLCGIPMAEAEGHYFDRRKWNGAASHRRGWTQALPRIQGRAKSMSGWTAEKLGRPDAAWLGA